MRKLLILVVVSLAVGACGGGDAGSSGLDGGDETEAVDTTVVDTSASPASPTTSADVAAAEPADTLETVLVTDLVYHESDERFSAASGLTDVIAPTEGGPWPTVVVFHGDPRFVSKTWHRSDATEIAAHGRVVFLPTWGKTTLGYDAASIDDTWNVVVQEASCAVAYAAAHAEDYGGDPDHLTLYGLSAGGNAVLMAGLAEAEPLETCAASGPAVTTQALVPIDADWVLGGSWDSQLTENPEAFYSITPWRHLDGSQNLHIYVMSTEDQTLVRSVEPDPATSWLSYRHPDIDLPAQLKAMGFLDDGKFGVVESADYAYQVLIDAGYNATRIVMPGARHEAWGEEGFQVVVETVLHASAAGDGEDR